MCEYKSQNSVIIFLGVLFIMAGVFRNILYAQTVDSFYTDLLKRGEQSYLDKNYEDAIKQFEVAAFGLHGVKDLSAKANLYLCLSHYALNDVEKSKQYLEKTEALLEGAELESLDMHEKAREGLEILMFHVRPEEPKNQELAGKSQEELEQEIKELNGQIKEDPTNTDLYLDLYNHYFAVKNYKEARKTSEKLVKQHPNEIQGYYMIGVAHFMEGKYGDAADDFNLFFQHSQRVAVDNETLIDARAYLTLSYYKDGERAKCYKIIEESIDVFSIRTIKTLSLDRNDKMLLWNLRKAFMEKTNIL